MAITINFNAETIVGNFCLGRIGEHNATELVITVPTALSGDPRTESYRVAFHTNGQTILSESYTESPITISLWRQLTLAPRLSLQVIAYDGAGDFVGKSVKLSGFYFEPSVMGDSVEADGSNPDLAHEILDIMAKNEEQDTRLDSDESAITALQNGKVDKVDGKGLSTEDYTTAEKEKLATLQNYVLPTASTSTLGGVKVDGETITITNGVIKATVQAGDYVRILTVTNGVANYGAGWLKQFHEEGKIVVYDECILEYSTETSNTIVYYYFDVKYSKQKKLTVTNSKDATIFEVQTYASNNQGISGTIKTLNEWLSQFNTDIGTLQVDLSTVQTGLANKQEKFVVINFTPTDTSDLTLGGTFDKTLAEMHELMSAGHYLLLKVVGVSATNVIQVGDSPSVFSAIYWQFITQNGNSRYLYTVGIDWQNGAERVIVRKFYFAPNEVTIDSTSKTVAEWITQLEGYNTITIGQQTKTVAEWVAYLQDQKAFKNVEIDGTTKTIALWLDQILDGQTYDSFSDVESAIGSLSSQIANKIDEPSSEGTNGQVLTTDGNGGRSWATISGGLMPVIQVTAPIGASVSVTDGTTTYTLTTEAEITNVNVNGFGTWTTSITANSRTYTKTYVVDTVKIYKVSFIGLPDGFTELQYVTVTSGYYINTGVSVNGHIDVRVKFRQTGNTSYGPHIFSNSSFYLARPYTYKYNNNESVSATPTRESIGLNTWATTSTDYANHQETVNNIVYTLNIGSQNTGGTLYFLNYSSPSANYGLNGDVAYGEIIDNGASVRHYIPCRKEDTNTVGFYDVAQNQFVTGSGGTITAGPEA